MSSDSETTTPFSETTDLQIKTLCGNRRWNCHAPLANAFPIIDEEDPAIDILQERGLLNFSITSPSNGIALCPKCEKTFYADVDPGWLLVPSDLDFFIDYEERDYQKRVKMAKNGVVQGRQCPSIGEYRDYQALQGEIAGDQPGGLCQCIYLRRCLPPLLPLEYLEVPKVWHGDPMAAIRRAFVGLGSVRIHRIPEDVQRGLRRLQFLYARPAPDAQSYGA